jgi:peptide/nickel transport system substrate-binding protein
VFKPLAGSLAAGLVAAASLVMTAMPVSAASGAPTSITLSEGVQIQPNFWLPSQPAEYCTVENGVFSWMAYRPLLWIANNDTIDYGQSIASGVAVSHDDTVYTISLHGTLKWSNGQVVTAQDALFAAQLLLKTSEPHAVWTQCGAGIGGWPSDIKSLAAPNARTLVVTTTQPVNPAWFEHNGLAQIYPLPVSVFHHSSNWTAEERWVLQVGRNPAAPQLQVVDGPYKFGPFANDAYSTLVANPAYNGPDKPTITRIRFLYSTSEQNYWAAALRHVFDQVSIPAQYNDQRQELVKAGYHLTYQQYDYCFNYAQPNFRATDPAHALLALKYVRQAIELGLNQQEMIKLADNIGYPIYGPVPSRPANVYYDPAVARYDLRYDPARGKRLLEAHGWHLQNGVMTKDGKTLTFTLLYPSGSLLTEDQVLVWQAGLRQEGIVFNVQPQEPNQLQATIDNTDKWEIAWDGGGWCYSPDYMPTGDGLFTPNGAANPGDYNDPTLNHLIAETLAPATPAQSQARMDAYQLYVAQALPVFWMPVTGGYNATVSWLHTPPSSNNPMQDITTFNTWFTTTP